MHRKKAPRKSAPPPTPIPLQALNEQETLLTDVSSLIICRMRGHIIRKD